MTNTRWPCESCVQIQRPGMADTQWHAGNFCVSCTVRPYYSVVLIRKACVSLRIGYPWQRQVIMSCDYSLLFTILSIPQRSACTCSYEYTDIWVFLLCCMCLVDTCFVLTHDVIVCFEGANTCTYTSEFLLGLCCTYKGNWESLCWRFHKFMNDTLPDFTLSVWVRILSSHIVCIPNHMGWLTTVSYSVVLIRKACVSLRISYPC